MTTGNSVRVRPVEADDAPRLAPLWGQLGFSCEADEARRRLELAVASPSRAVLVAERGPEGVVGYLELRQIPSLMLGETEAELLSLVVDEAARRGGVGRALMAAAEDWTRSRGCRLLRLRTNIVRPEAHAFYESLGYARLKTQHIYRKEL